MLHNTRGIVECLELDGDDIKDCRVVEVFTGGNYAERAKEYADELNSLYRNKFRRYVAYTEQI